jgi:hypothetical protein
MEMIIRVKSIVALSVILFFSFSGCATYHYQKPAPAQPQKISVKVSEMGFTDKNIPVGVYRVPESPIIVTGHQGKPGAFSAFGLLGMLTYVGTRSAKGENAVGYARNNLNIGIKNQIVSALEPLINEKPYNESGLDN